MRFMKGEQHWSLLDLLKEKCRSQWGRSYLFNCSVEKNPPKVTWETVGKFPSVYPSSDELLFRALSRGFHWLLENVNEHAGGDNRLIRAVRKGRLQTVELYWDGERPSDERLAEVNRNYQLGTRRDTLPNKFGTVISGYLFHSLGGSVIIEKTGGIYVARNVIKIPIPARSTK